MGTAQSTDEQKTTALEAENEKLKEEIKRLKLKLGVSQDDDADSGADSGVDSGPDSGTDSGREETPSMEYVSDDNMSIEEMITRGLRLQPLFDEKGECVEVVATVVDDIKVDPPGEDSLKENAPKKKKKKGDKKKKKKKKISQTKKMKKHQRPSRRKTPIIVAQVDVESLMHAVDVEENEDIIQKARNLKRKVLEDAQKHDPTVRLVEDASTIEDLLEAELKKGEHSAFYFVNLGAVVEKWFQWTKYFPTITPFYAMKSNPDIHIVRTLHYLGTGFDCASKAELDEAISVGVPADKIIFANPCKGKEHILFAKQIGVEMMTFDSMDELNKIYSLYPTAKLVLRILPDDSHSLMPFGTKFGASYSEACKLIIHCAKLGAQLIGVSFHVGSGCFSSMAWIDAISLAKRVFDQAEKQGFKLTLLDIGGGWPGTDNGPLIIEDINEAINRHLKELFPPEVKIIAEPGRFFCTSSYTLAVTVTSRRERYRAIQDRIEAEKSAQKALEEGDNLETTPEEPLEREKEVLYYLSDGVYGSFNNIVFDHAKPSPATFKDPNSATRKSCLFGPTCDSIDVICKDIDLPEMEIGDWLYFMNMGAYTVASASHFNGFSPPNAFYVVCIDNPKTKVASPQLPASNSEKH